VLTDGFACSFIVVSGVMTGCAFAVGAMVRARAMAARANTDTRNEHGESEEENGYIVPIVVRPNDAVQSFVYLSPSCLCFHSDCRQLTASIT
jgi:hypothetical protein